MGKARITYRFGHDDQDTRILQAQPSEQADEAVAVSGDEPVLNAFTSEYRGWTSPIDSEVQRLEELIRNANPPAATVEPDLPENASDKHEDFDHWGKFVDDRYVSYRHHTNRTPWLKMIVTVCGAILTGIVLGMFVLTLFNPGPDMKLATQDLNDSGSLPVDESPDPIQSVLDNVDSPSTTQETDPSSFELPAQVFQVLQVGVFATVDAANQIANDLRHQGLAAVIEQDEAYHVYAGVSSSRDDILGLKKELETRELETYIKSYEVPTTQLFVRGGTSRNIPKSYFTDMNDLIHSISALTLWHVQQASLTAIPDSTMDEIQAQQKEMMLAAVQTANGFPEQVSDRLEQLNNEMNAAIEALVAYRKNPSRSFLWQAQSAIMQVMLLEKQVLSLTTSPM